MPSFEDRTPDPNYILVTQQTQISCHKGGYSKNLATDCTVQGNFSRRGLQNLIIVNL